MIEEEIELDKFGYPRPGFIVKLYREKMTYIDNDGVEKHWTQAMLAEKLGVSEVLVRQMENHDKYVQSIDRRRFLADLLNIPPALLGLSTLPQLDTVLKGPTVSNIITSKHSGVNKEVITGYQDVLGVYDGLYVDRVVKPSIGNVETLIAQITNDTNNTGQTQQTKLQHILWQFHQFAAKVYGYDLGNWQEANRHIKEGLELAVLLDNIDLKVRNLYLSTNLQLILFNRPLQVQTELDGALLYAQSATPSNKAAISALAAVVYSGVATDYASRLKVENLLAGAEKGINTSSDGISMQFTSTLYRCKKADTLIALGKYNRALDSIDEADSFASHKREQENTNILRAKLFIKKSKPEYEQAVFLLQNILEDNKYAKEQSHLKKVERLFHLLAESPYGKHPDVVQLGLNLRELQR